MKSHGKRTLGIDICPGRVSAALLERTGQEYRVIASASNELTKGDAGRDSVEQARAVSRTIRKLGRRARSPRVKAALSLSANPVLIQILDMPKHMPANIREFVGSELRQYVALSGRNTVFDFCGIGPGADGRKRMLAVAVEKERARAAASACARMGVTLEAVEPSLLAYARAFHAGRRQEKNGRNVLIAVLDGGNLVLSLFCRGVLEFVRVRDIPPEMREANSLRDWLAEELKAVIRYQNAGGANSATWHARLIVQSHHLSPKELEPSLRATTGMEGLVVTDALEPFPGPGTDGGGEREETASLMAVGAAMKASDPEADDLKINLLPAEVRRARMAARHALLTAIAGACAFLGVLLAVFLLSRAADVTREQVERTKIDKQLYATRALIAQDKFLDEEILRVQEQLKPLQTLLAGRRDVDWSAVLNALRRVAPAGVCVTELSDDDGGRLTMKGLAVSCEVAQSFAHGLDGNGPFVSASMARIARQQGGSGLMEYQIDCALRPREAQR